MKFSIKDFFSNNVTKDAGKCGFGHSHIYWRNCNGNFLMEGGGEEESGRDNGVYAWFSNKLDRFCVIKKLIM